jgi:hypothetical protein
VPQRDVHHQTVRAALERDGWVITHDPLPLRFGVRRLYVDLGAEAPLAAEKGGRKIAVEVKSFLGESEMKELERALGQFALYRFLLARDDPARVLFLAIAREVFGRLFADKDGLELITAQALRMLVFDLKTGALVQWIE